MKKKIDLSKKFTAYQINNIGRFYQSEVFGACDYVQRCKRKDKKAYEETADSLRFKWFLEDVLHETVVCNKSIEWGLKRFDKFMDTLHSAAMKEYVCYAKLALSTLQIQYTKYLIYRKRAYPIYETDKLVWCVEDAILEDALG